MPPLRWRLDHFRAQSLRAILNPGKSGAGNSANLLSSGALNHDLLSDEMNPSQSQTFTILVVFDGSPARVVPSNRQRRGTAISPGKGALWIAAVFSRPLEP
jgi:hypothetical protein